jgi:hypothetical protein
MFDSFRNKKLSTQYMICVVTTIAEVSVSVFQDSNASPAYISEGYYKGGKGVQ